MIADRKPVLYCYDGSDACRQALRTAYETLGDRPSIVITCWPSIWAAPEDITFSLAPQDVIDQALKAEHDQAAGLAREGAELILGAEPVALQSDTSVWRTILQYADEHDAAVIVCGSHGRGAIASLVLGSVSHGLVGHSHRPVLVVRH